MISTANTTESVTMSIAKTILDQIKYGDRMALMAWGASNMQALPMTEDFEGGLDMVVRGITFKGTVRVQLTYTDEYVVSFFSKAGKLVKKCENVYCDMLVEIIDWVEGR